MVCVNMFFARHGQTDANAQLRLQGSGLNGPLSTIGRQQASALADGLRSQNLDMVVASGMERAIETARHVLVHYPGVELATDARLNEISWGIMDGETFKVADVLVQPVVEKWNSGDFDARIEKGESINDCRRRLLAAVSDILLAVRKEGSRNVLVCMHGRVLRVLMAALVDKDMRKMQRYTHTNCCYHQISVDLDMDDDSIIDLDKLVFEAVRIDVRDHLKSLEVDRPDTVDSV
ncbi:hypothetical protein GGI21_001787 [Coemansia aciculifera]|uniref:Uncharacterized protein n=1 Tax=Coemansia aciculifera TaxID=417176 RepID=A0ACC1M942_9FUNG|nr:hypothetical protein IWW38_000451 [Coemansia aciculifera]KAJ2909536.1 hypothetical protein GGI21_001787 [Coemansia aciculifera]